MAREFKVIVAGSRTAGNTPSTYELLRQKLNLILAKKSITHDIVIVSGGAKGADLWGELYAKEYNYKLKRYPADWKTHGKRAGYLRNETMAVNADALVALWDGASRGTQHMINIAAHRGLPTRIIRFGE